MRLMTDCDVITHSIVKQTWHITTKGEAAGKYTTMTSSGIFEKVFFVGQRYRRMEDLKP